MEVGWVLPVAWVGLGAVIVVSSIRAGSSPRAYRVGVLSVSALWVLAGAAVNGYFLARGDDYSGFADGASTSYVQDTWESLVVPHHTTFIGLLIAFEAVVGLLVLVEGPVRQVALVLLIGFTVALVPFGWGYLVWSVPMTLALVLLFRAGRVHRRTHGTAVDLTAPPPGALP
ncbi:hypothetical protein [Nocardioides sp. GXQ0305]|uniref:hypothetical protein n=1 Tax=Nocardioides sp. GXQ0305 TaxID=3423912 RepID=UPI003D7E7EEA